MITTPLLVGGIVGIILIVLISIYLSRRSHSGKVSPIETALRESEYQPFKLIQRESITSNTYKFRFALPNDNMILGLPIGKHMLLRFKDIETGKLLSRPYTPVSSDNDRGYFDLLIKIYPQGKMGPYLQSLPINSTVDVRGPLGQLEYKRNGLFGIQRKILSPTGTTISSWADSRIKRVGMIAGGTGITPMLQIIRAVCSNPTDKLELNLIFANVTAADILLKAELDAAAAANPRFTVTYTLDKPTTDWTGETGFVTSTMIQKYLPGPAVDSIILLCGPKPMIDFMEKNLKGLDYTESQYFKF